MLNYTKDLQNAIVKFCWFPNFSYMLTFLIFIFQPNPACLNNVKGAIDFIGTSHINGGSRIWLFMGQTVNTFFILVSSY